MGDIQCDGSAPLTGRRPTGAEENNSTLINNALTAVCIFMLTVLMYGFLNSVCNAFIQLCPILSAPNFFVIILDSASSLFFSVLTFCSGEGISRVTFAPGGVGAGEGGVSARGTLVGGGEFSAVSDTSSCDL